MKLRGFIEKSLTLIAFGLALTLLTVPAIATPFVYVVNGNSQFGVVNLTTGGFHAIGGPEPEPQANLVWGPGGSTVHP